MKAQSKTRALLLGYLVFFLNLGPSFHRAPIFGLHGSRDASNHCGCGHSHGFAEYENADGSQLQTPLCDCQLCHFFQNYNASVLNQEILGDCHTELAAIQLQRTEKHNTIVAHPGRGPPVA